MQSAPHIPPPTTHRRALLSSAALVVAAHASPVPAASADALVRRGMQRFQAGDVEGSLVDFDAVYEASPSLRPYLWQRGLSLYYAGDHSADHCVDCPASTTDHSQHPYMQAGMSKAQHSFGWTWR